MKTKVIFLSCCALLGLSITAQAQWQGEWVIGFSGDLAERKGNLNVNLAYSGLPTLPRTDLIEEHTDRGYLGEIFGGYQVTCDNWLIGGEVNVELNDIDEPIHFAFTDIFHAVGWSASGHFKTKPVVGVTGRLGYQMASFLLAYLRLGVEGSKDTIDLTFTADPAVLPVAITLNDARWRAQYIAGFGFEIPLPLYSCPSVRLEYIYRSYFNDRGVEDNGFIQTGFLNPFFSVSTHPRTQTGKLSVVWNF